jgi:hypothetical protein
MSIGGTAIYLEAASQDYSDYIYVELPSFG